MAANVNLMQIDSAMKVVANKNIKKGEMIVQQRAIASNLDVFINSGFLPGNNEHNNTAMITCTIEPEDPLFATKLELIQTSKNSRNFLVSRNITTQRIFDTIGYLRYVVFNEDPSYLILAKN